ncbi:permease [candidate division KSB1 bacterium]|nr:permease [candidate division KSB1 bacterium]
MTAYVHALRLRWQDWRLAISASAEEWKKFIWLIAAFLAFYFLPITSAGATRALAGGLVLLQEYARQHVLTCLVPAFFIAGGIAVYVKKDSILQLLGPTAKKYIAYPVASVSGGLLAVCSCTILPLFAGIYKRGAGIGPAIAFLFSGPAINVTAIILTSSVIGVDFAVGRLIFAMSIALIAGVIMMLLFRDHDRKNGKGFVVSGVEEVTYSTASILAFFVLQLIILVVFGLGIAQGWKYAIAATALVFLAGLALKKFSTEDNRRWIAETWDLSKKIMPYLFLGIFFAGAVGEILPESWVTTAVGGNSLTANAIASVSGALMYFATLTEVPIIQKLMQLGMGRGPAMTLFFTGNALSIPSMLVLFKLMGARKAATYILIVVALSVGAGWLWGNLSFGV